MSRLMLFRNATALLALGLSASVVLSAPVRRPAPPSPAPRPPVVIIPTTPATPIICDPVVTCGNGGIFSASNC